MNWRDSTAVILGIDASLNQTGVAVVDLCTGTVIGTTVFGSPRLREGDRLAANLQALKDFMAPHVRKIVGVGLEDYAYHAQVAKPAEWGGVIKYFLYQEHRLTPVLIAPTTLIKFFTGNGRAPQSLIALEAYKRFQWEYDTEDELDAVGLADIARRCRLYPDPQWSEGLVQKQSEAVATIIKKEHGISKLAGTGSAKNIAKRITINLAEFRDPD